MCGCSKGRPCACKESSTSLNSFPWSAMADGLGVARIDGHADNGTGERDGEEQSFTVRVLLESYKVEADRGRRRSVQMKMSSVP